MAHIYDPFIFIILGALCSFLEIHHELFFRVPGALFTHILLYKGYSIYTPSLPKTFLEKKEKCPLFSGI